MNKRPKTKFSPNFKKVMELYNFKTKALEIIKENNPGIIIEDIELYDLNNILGIIRDYYSLLNLYKAP